jgi:hypothetical protein
LSGIASNIEIYESHLIQTRLGKIPLPTAESAEWLEITKLYSYSRGIFLLIFPTALKK